ncbi:tail assembly chaperone [uncultured Thomasclavelia sp.]|uniref:tail assembly chaperone n=1 Tax=uncultured Thomasclavelia sp. TaxID=3025759 RepID=UPI002611F34A|nr:tail assembly chaperone [uncultured Thomasclavelia sp.]
MVLELTINDQVYEFKAGIGFLRDVNKKVQQKIDGTNRVKDMGLQYLVAGIIDGDIEDLIDALDLMNKGCEPRLTRKQIERYIEEVEDIEKLFDTVLGFLKNANVSKRITKDLLKRVEENQKDQKK